MMIKRNVVYIAGSLFIALFVIVYGISTMPSRLLKVRNEAYLKMAGGYNVFLHLPRADARWDTFVSPSPDLMYSVLVFNTGEHPIVVEFPPPSRLLGQSDGCGQYGQLCLYRKSNRV